MCSTLRRHRDIDHPFLFQESVLWVYHCVNSSEMPIDRKRDGSVFDKPAEGWLHDERKLAAGRGVYIGYPCKWVANVQLPGSVRGYDVEQQTTIARLAIELAFTAKTGAVPMDSLRPKTDYKYGSVQKIKPGMPCTINISTTGIILSPPGAETTGEKYCFTPMRLISLAAGGEHDTYNWITYVGKDAKSGQRQAFIIDCGEEFVDEVLMTIGQAFNLAVAKREKKPVQKPVKPVKKPPALNTLAEVEEEAAIPDEVQELLYDIGSAPPAAGADAAVYDIGAAPAFKAMSLNRKGEVDDVTAELLRLMQSEATAVYASSDDVAKPDLTKLVGVFNKTKTAAERFQEQVALRRASQQEVNRPTWVYFKPADDASMRRGSSSFASYLEAAEQ